MKNKGISSRLNKYYIGFLDEFIFDNFSQNALMRLNGQGILEDVPIPMQRQDLASLISGDGISPMKLAENMICVIGCDSEFQYNGAYIEFIKRLLGIKLNDIIMGAGDRVARTGELFQASIYFRAMLMIDNENTEAMYAYAMVLKELYKNQEDEEFVGNVKAETIENLEKVTILNPENREAFYFLGYGYLNMGLYKKAQISFETYLEQPTSFEQKNEIMEMMEKLKNPCEIEDGINAVLTGQYTKGLEILSKYTSGEYEKNWTIHYYVGIAYVALGENDMAITALKRVLQLNAANLDSMRMLAEAYRIKGDTEMERKYRKKMEIVEKNIEEN